MRSALLPLMVLVLGVLLGGASGCSDADISRLPPQRGPAVDNKLSIQSTLCLSTPGEVIFPVKLAFVIDTSTSMEISDPIDPMQPDPTLASGRSRALRAVIDKFADQPGLEIGIVKFGASANVVTNCGMAGPCYIPVTKANLGALYSSVVELNVAAGTTDYEGALSATFQLMSNDMKNKDKVSLARSRYLVVFMSDGLPDPQTSDYNNRNSILDVVTNIMTLRDVYGVGQIQVNAALLATGKPDFIQIIEQQVLQAMSDRGKGLYRSFPNGESINFLNYDITSLRRSFALKSFLAVPQNTAPRGGPLLVDSDGDGLPDELERRLGTSPLRADTDGDGFSDLLEYRFRISGFDPLNRGDADCALPTDRLDTDGDGVLDCEERFIGTSRFLVDSDGDGLPDGVELRAGTDPTRPDVIGDTDQDGTSNTIEVESHTDPLLPDAQDRSQIAQRYLRRDLPPAAGVSADEAARPCFDFSVDNLSLLQTLPVNGDDGGWNQIRLWAGEVPFDNPGENGTYRTACVRARFFNSGDKLPPSGKVVLPREAWVPAGMTPTCYGP